MTLAPVPHQGDFIDGRFRPAEAPDDQWEIRSPADLTDVVGRPTTKHAHLEDALESARRAYLPWARLGAAERARHLRRLRDVFSNRAAEFAEIIARETGKPLWECKGEAQSIVNKIDITLNHSLGLVADQEIADALPGVTGYTRFKPRGVMAVIGPFNFPAHLPNGHIIPALATGNVVVFKPSEKTPFTGQLMARCFAEAELPAGVFNLVQGRGETGKRLANHRGVDGVLFTGSYDVGLRIKQDTLTHSHKLLALEMGGKNATVIWDDADLTKATYESLMGAFVSAGQRCSCTSRIIVHRRVHQEFTDRFYANAKRLKIGHWSEPVFMGPLISADSVDGYLRYQEIAKREGAEPLMRGKALELGHRGHYVTPSINLVKAFDPQSVYQQSEIFGPNVAIYKVDDFEEALRINNAPGFGLVMSLFTKNRALFEKALIEAQVGVLNLNRTTNGASSRLPFGGMNKSGNDRPSAHLAVQYCTVPVASLEDPTPFNGQGVPVGLNFEE
jgi:succinylglutamic semialdehyde dehydrogenase